MAKTRWKTRRCFDCQGVFRVSLVSEDYSCPYCGSDNCGGFGVIVERSLKKSLEMIK